MLRTFGDSRAFRSIAIGSFAVVAALALAVDPADARRGKRSAKKGGGFNPPYSAIVVDANSGSVLHAAEADSIRHPASLTKIMTLYLLFERIEAGKIKLETPLKVSEHASEQSPTKLGLKEGQTITVDEAIRGLVTKSANDAAVVIAEAIAGDEDDFAKLMTRKARALGMSRTVYKNASGLPDREQVTTARDQALLGRAIQDRFPRHYRYFSTASFTFRGKTMRNHNHLLGSVKGVDGIKTGYVNASGYNLVASMRRDNRHLVAVVLGGKSGGARDDRMRSLLDKHVADASVRRTAPMVAERDGEASAVVVASAGDAPYAPQPTSAATPMPAAVATTAAPPSAATPAPAKLISTTTINAGGGESLTTATLPTQKAATTAVEPIKPIAVKTIKVKLDGVQTASLTPPLAHLPVVTSAGLIAPKASAAPARAAEPAKKSIEALPAVSAAAPTPAESAFAKTGAAPAKPIQQAAAAPAPAPAAVQPVIEAAAPAPAKVATPVQVANASALALPSEIAAAEAASDSAGRKIVHTGWIIQVGAFEAEREAKDRLSSAQSKAKHLLARADAFTETVVKDNKTFFRARFAGFDKDEAMAACKYLKRNDFACMTLKN
jgi:D-alanyl-D-alanine carboxypeptidase